MTIQKENLLALIGLILFSAVVFVILSIGVRKAERLECLKWQKEAMEYPDYYLTDWQKAQCEHYNIKIKLN